MTPPTPTLYPGERLDQLGFQGLRIIQDPKKFKFTIDAFLLTGFIRPKPRHRILDLGTGNGVLTLLLAGQDKPSAVCGIEIQGELAELARRNVVLNMLDETVHIIHGDLRTLPGDLKPNSFDYVISNPPYFPLESGVISANEALATAKFEIACTLDDLVKAAARMVKGNGVVAFIYPTARFEEMLVLLRHYHLAPKRIRFVHPRPAESSQLFLIEAAPGAKGGLSVEAPLLICQSSDEYSEEMNQIFHGKRS